MLWKKTHIKVVFFRKKFRDKAVPFVTSQRVNIQSLRDLDVLKLVQVKERMQGGPFS